MNELNLDPVGELIEVWEDAPLEFISTKGLTEEFEEWSKRKFKEKTGIKWTKRYERFGFD